jgi:RNA 2',3'-cyclic 3'-phosphodiesterase
MAMYRLFAAIDLPEQLKEEVAALGRNLTGARWVPMDQLHLTLRFMGDADENLFQDIRRTLGEVRGAPFQLTLTGKGHFPPGREPRVLWVGMEKNRALDKLQERVERAVIAVGIPAETRRFSSHITLARLRNGSPAEVSEWERRQVAFSDPVFAVEEFHLYSSILTRDGAVHRREATYPLAG